MDHLKQPADAGDAARLVRAYLLGLGIIGEATLDRISKQVLDSAREKDAARPASAAIEIVLRQKDAWFRALTQASERDQPRFADPLIGWRVRAMFLQRPDDYLCQPSPQSIGHFALAMNWQSVPEVHPGLMPAQTLGEMPAAFKREFWRKAVSWVWVSWRKSVRRRG